MKPGVGIPISYLACVTSSMAPIITERSREAEELLDEVCSWSDEEIEALPKFYREKARKYRRQANRGEE